MKNIVLNNGVKIPQIGFGTWRTPDGTVCVESVKEALRVGYRHIDGAALYGNEESVGQAIRASGVDRTEIFLTSKLWNTELTYEATVRAFEKTLQDLGTDYLDLYLIHWPNPVTCRDCWEERNAEVWRAFEDLYKSGKVKAIGVSNFLEHHLQALMKTATVTPAVNQIEINPGFPQETIVDYCKAHGIAVEAWSPLADGKIFAFEALQQLAAKYNRSIAQVTLRWLLQRDIIPLSKSVTPSRIAENFNLFDFKLSNEDMLKISQISTDVSTGSHPDRVDF